MNQDELLSLLEQTLRQKLIIAGILWLFAILSLIRSEICYKKGKISSKKRGRMFLLGAILILIMPVLEGSWCISAIKDINSKQIVTAEGSYRHDATSHHRTELLENGRIYVKIDGESKVFDLPYGWTKEQFPEGEYYGTIVYGQDSEVILQFIPHDG